MNETMTDMDTERQTMLADMAAGVFAGIGWQAEFDRDWPRMAELGFSGLLLSEDEGGFGGSWSDLLVVARLAGEHALALPVLESAVASRLVAGLEFEGVGTLAPSSDGELSGDTWSGTLSAVPWGRHAGFVIAGEEGGAVAIDTSDAQITERTGLSGEPRDKLALQNARAVRVDGDPLALGAAIRAMQIAGALGKALAISANYVSERQQFGRPLAKFQAVQQSLAQMAMESAAADCAAFELARSLDRDDASFETAAAKTRAGMAASTGAALAHQVHGAIGFTREYALHHLTRRMLAWRSEFGGEAYWSERLGRDIVSAGADRLWSDLVARTDP